MSSFVAQAIDSGTKFRRRHGVHACLSDDAISLTFEIGNTQMATQTATLQTRPLPSSDGILLPAFTLWWREIVRFYRQRARVVGVIASPLLFWIVIGSGFGTSFRSGEGPGQDHYLDYFFPGALIMIVLFTAIFTMMSVIEDRKEGFLLSVLVAPVPRSAIVLGKVLGGTTLAAAQGLLFLVFAPFVGIHFHFIQFLLILLWSSWFRSLSLRSGSRSLGQWIRPRPSMASSICS